jgi:hypothetical protein
MLCLFPESRSIQASGEIFSTAIRQILPALLQQANFSPFAPIWHQQFQKRLPTSRKILSINEIGESACFAQPGPRRVAAASLFVILARKSRSHLAWGPLARPIRLAHSPNLRRRF